jgi:hypothetical protein
MPREPDNAVLCKHLSDGALLPPHPLIGSSDDERWSPAWFRLSAP